MSHRIVIQYLLFCTCVLKIEKN